MPSKKTSLYENIYVGVLAPMCTLGMYVSLCLFVYVHACVSSPFLERDIYVAFCVIPVARVSTIFLSTPSIYL